MGLGRTLIILPQAALLFDRDGEMGRIMQIWQYESLSHNFSSCALRLLAYFGNALQLPILLIQQSDFRVLQLYTVIHLIFFWLFITHLRIFQQCFAISFKRSNAYFSLSLFPSEHKSIISISIVLCYFKPTCERKRFCWIDIFF